MTVFFHGNFGLNRHYMAKLVMLASKDQSLSDEELAKEFGYGAPFAATYRSWLHKVGIAQLGRPLKLTELGQIVLANDPNFNSLVTAWFLHHELTADPQRAEAWHFFIHEFRPKNPAFTRSDLMQGLMMKLRSHSERHFGPESKMNPIITRKLLECYTNPDALGDLGLVVSKAKDEFEFADVQPLGLWSDTKALADAYRTV